MPTHNVGARINANILNTCLMGSNDVEVIIRDNSGNEMKRDFLTRVQEKGCRIISVDECSGLENHRRLLEEASGDFVFVVGDDDFANGYATSSILAEIEKIADSPDIIGTTGIFIMDTNDKGLSRVINFNCFNEPSALSRINTFFLEGDCCHSIFQYSPLRREILKSVLDFSSTFPVYLSHTDWLMNCMYLMHGRLTTTNRFLYHYINANWTDADTSLRSDAHYFKMAGLDASGVRLQWLIAVFEGAQTYARKYQGVQLSELERQGISGLWVRKWFHHFSMNKWSRQAEGAKFDAQAIRMALKWKDAKEILLDNLLLDIVDYYSLSSPETAQRYYDFWK
jgi:hypothetical protein